MQLFYRVIKILICIYLNSDDMKKYKYIKNYFIAIILMFLLWGGIDMREVRYVNGFADPKSIDPKWVENPDSIDVLVNKFHALPKGWEPQDLEKIISYNEKDMYLRKEAKLAWEELEQEARALGMIIHVVSSYRDEDYQSFLFYHNLDLDPYRAIAYSAIPRRSEHELGLAIDVSFDDHLYDDFNEHPIGIWMSKNAHRFGFILRYPKDKTQITHYGYEPWHFRYVGRTLAETLYKDRITLEEYTQNK